MGVKSKEVKIYAPAHFKPTWEKFKKICDRDGTSASEQVRIWVEGFVARKDPGNPQRPLTAFVEGHPDEQAARYSGLLQELLTIAQNRGGEIRYSMIVRALRERRNSQR